MSSTIDITLEANYKGRSELKNFTDQIEQVGKEFLTLRERAAGLRRSMKETGDQFGRDSVHYQNYKRAVEEIQVEEIRLRKQLEQIRDAMRESGAEADNLRVDTKDLGAMMEWSAGKTKEFENSTRYARLALDKYGDAADLTEAQLLDLRQEENRAEEALKQLGRAADKARGDFHQLEGAVDRAGDEIEQTKDKATGLGALLSDPKGLFGAGIVTSMGARAFDLIIDGVRELGRYLWEANLQFGEFDGRIRELYTLVDDTVLGQYFEDNIPWTIRNLNIELARLSDETLPAAYQALSSGLAPEQVENALRAADMLARTTRAGLEDTLLMIQRIVAAYDTSSMNPDRIADYLFRIVRSGIVRMDELNDTLNQINSVAAEVKLPFEDIAGAIITMTRQGDDMAEVAELMSNMLIQLQIPTTPLGSAFKDAAGQGFREFIEAGGDLVGAMNIIESAAKSAGVGILELVVGTSKFYRDTISGRAVLELTGSHLADFEQNAKQAASSTGELAAAFNEVADSAEIANQRTASIWEQTKTTAGEVVQPKASWWRRQIDEGLSAINYEMEKILRGRTVREWSEKNARYFHDAIEEGFGYEMDRLNAGLHLEGVMRAVMGQADFIDEHSMEDWAEYQQFFGEALTKFNLFADLSPENVQAANEWVFWMRAIRFEIENMIALSEHGGNLEPTIEGPRDSPGLQARLGQVQFAKKAWGEMGTMMTEVGQKARDIMAQGALELPTLTKGSERIMKLRDDMILLKEAQEQLAIMDTERNLFIQDFAGKELAAAESTWTLESALWSSLQAVELGPEAYMAAALTLTEYGEAAVMTALKHAMIQDAINQVVPLIGKAGFTWEDAYNAVLGYSEAVNEADTPVELDIDINDFVKGARTAKGELDAIVDKVVTITINRVDNFGVADYNGDGIPDTQQDLEDLGIITPPGGDAAAHWGDWISEHNVRRTLLPGERVLGQQEVNNMGGRYAVDRMARGGFGAGTNIYVNSNEQALIVSELWRGQAWRR